MQDAVSSDFVFLDGRGFPQHSGRDQDASFLSPEVTISELGHSFSTPAIPNPILLFQASPHIVTPPHWLLSVLLGTSASFCPQDKLLF